jgi:hypothetical protein
MNKLTFLLMYMCLPVNVYVTYKPNILHCIPIVFTSNERYIALSMLVFSHFFSFIFYFLFFVSLYHKFCLLIFYQHMYHDIIFVYICYFKSKICFTSKTNALRYCELYALVSGDNNIDYGVIHIYLCLFLFRRFLYKSR